MITRGTDAVGGGISHKTEAPTTTAPTTGSSGYKYYYYSSGGSTPAPAKKDWSGSITSDETVDDALVNPNAAETTKQIVENAKSGINQDVNLGRIDHIDTTYQKQLIDQLTQAQRDQVNNTIDRSVTQGTTELQRTLSDSANTYNDTMAQIDRDERRALDNQALTRAASGDRGGVGQSQYNSIMNTAATNRMTVRNERTKLMTDVNRQISDLRSQGEFERADGLLTVTQNYLQQLLDLEQYAQTTNLGIDEFNTSLQQWEENYKLSVSQYLTETELNAANATGAFSSGAMTQTAWNNMREQLASAAEALLKAGVAPTTEQLAAIGMTKGQGAGYLARYYPYG